MGKIKCIIILSSKSSGSSALQSLLVRFNQVRIVSKTRHFENETLFWTKAASILHLPQVRMLDSEVPISYEKARIDLLNLLKDNVDSYVPPTNDEEMIFNGWKLLCQKHSPIFLEKSPHHLHQWSALVLIAECVKRFQEIDFLLVGLVRNPMDVLYSAWNRRRTVPEKNQYQWFTAYENLLRLRKLVGKKLVVVRYEEMVKDISTLKEIFQFISATEDQIETDYLHEKSLAKWKKDKKYGFKLSKKVLSLAEKFGYDKQDMVNKNNMFWHYYKYLVRYKYKWSTR